MAKKKDVEKNNVISITSAKGKKSKKLEVNKVDRGIENEPLFITMDKGFIKTQPCVKEYFISQYISYFSNVEGDMVITKDEVDINNSEVEFTFTSYSLINNLMSMHDNGVINGINNMFNALSKELGDKGGNTKHVNAKDIEKIDKYYLEQILELIKNGYIENIFMRISLTKVKSRNGRMVERNPLYVHINIPNMEMYIKGGELKGLVDKLLKREKELVKKYNKLCKHIDYLREKLFKVKDENSELLLKLKQYEE